MSENKERAWLPLDLIKTTAEYLQKKGAQSPRLDAEVLLCSILECTRVKLYTIFDKTLTPAQLDKFRDMVRRRANHEPVSRILGRKEFMGVDFIVTPAVLSPRPETEILVEKAINLLDTTPKKKRSDDFFKKWDKKNVALLKEQIANNKDIEVPAEVEAYLAEKEHIEECHVDPVGETGIRRILDLGTGSGCIPISIIKFCKNVTAVAADISTDALNVAKKNALTQQVEKKINFIESDFFKAIGIEEKFDIILSNPPYLIFGDEGIWPEVSDYDPELALYAGSDGLDCYRIIIAGVEKYLAKGGWLLLELGAEQSAIVSQMILDKFPIAEIEEIPDHSGIVRVLAVTSIV